MWPWLWHILLGNRISLWVQGIRSQWWGLGHAGAQLVGLVADECGGTSQWQETGPNPGPQAAAVDLGWLSVCPSLAAGSGCVYGSGGRRWASCKGTAGGHCSELVHSGGGQLWESRMPSYSLTDAESWAGCQWRFWTLVGAERREWEGPQAADDNKLNNCGGKTSEICRQFTVALMARGSFSGKGCWGCVQSVTGNCGHSPCRAEIGGPCFSPLFPAFSICLSFAPLWVQWNQSRSSVWCPEWLGKLITHSDQVFCFTTFLNLGLPWWLRGKEPTWNAGDMGSVPELGIFPGEGNGNPLQYSCLGNLMDRGAWWATVLGITKGSDTI